MVEFVALSMPTVAYVLVRRRRLGTREAARRAGLGLAGWAAYAWGLGLTAVLLVGFVIAQRMIPVDVLNRPGVVIGATTTAAGVLAMCCAPWARRSSSVASPPAR